jgi:hypothetical protein
VSVEADPPFVLQALKRKSPGAVWLLRGSVDRAALRTPAAVAMVWRPSPAGSGNATTAPGVTVMVVVSQGRRDCGCGNQQGQ